MAKKYIIREMKILEKDIDILLAVLVEPGKPNVIKKIKSY
jgi:hypothetical protein